ncbi:ethanolaminephosphotransferase 1-like isoform X2 [Spodoptera litura]|nr:ethanolaminephosphotransferase 1-like isoform X2 [Spodoptera litura]XP_022818345.1 ethanolaminephosphotransferase 1-like isoform X2 [Spodoptera litura]XP_022818346.1 ethanolaminephosphotransferase 1-like isoform X2 [Spodoptera litura]
MFDYKYLSKEEIKGFNKYKYSAIDTSPLSKYVMHPTWNTVVKFIPKSIAPNLITFAGFLCMVIAVVTLSVYDYDFYAVGGRPGVVGYQSEVPNWVFTMCGVLIFLAYNLDGIDGKQARRIGVSGPLGELFDHGLDSFIVFLVPYSLVSVYGRDQEYSVSCFRGLLIVISVVMNFYVSHCEKYNTGVLYLPWSYDLSMWVSALLFLFAGAYGPEFYKYYVFGDVTFTQALEAVIHCMGFITTYPVAVYNVYLSNKNRTGKRYPILQATKPIWSMLVMTGATIYWAVQSPNNVIEVYPRAFIFMFGTLFSNISCRLIIAEMSHSRCELLSWMTWPLLGGMVMSLCQPQLEAIILHLLSALFLFTHVHYGICVVRQICNHFKINCFTVPKDKRK